MEIKEIPIYNPGILCSTNPEPVFTELLNLVDLKIKNKNVNQKLQRSVFSDSTVSGIEELLPVKLPKSYETYLSDFSKEYVNHFKIKSPEHYNVRITSAWLNLQKKHEFRPLHRHIGHSQLSFVTYVKIPYDLELEDNHPGHTKASVYRNGRIEFWFNKLSGEPGALRLDIDKTWEGKTILFSSSLFHSVYPFYTSDEYRISLAGNILLDF